MRIEYAGSFLVENIWKVVVFFRGGAEVNGCIRECRVGLCGHLREGKLEDLVPSILQIQANAAALKRTNFVLKSIIIH